MAALLRSVRFVNRLPSGLVHVRGSNRSGPPLSRLYSGALGGEVTGICSRLIFTSSKNPVSRVWPYTAGCVQNYSFVTVQSNKNDNLQQVQSKTYDWSMAKFDSSLSRTGRVTKNMLFRIFKNIQQFGQPSSTQALLLLHSCGSLLPEETLKERNDLAQYFWAELKKLGVQYEITHYNALLKVYLQNEFRFSPVEFLAELDAANIQPDEVTYRRLVTAYCLDGDINGASTILGLMKDNNLPINETIFNSLLLGHARAGDIQSAKNILLVMEGAGIKPGPDTYVALLKVYAERGDLDSLKQTLEEAASVNCHLTKRDLMTVIFTLAKSGHEEHVPHMLQHLRPTETSHVSDVMNFSLTLITAGKEDSAFAIMNTLTMANSNIVRSNLGNFFLRHCVNMNLPFEKIIYFCDELLKSGKHSAPLAFSLFCALEAKNTDLSLELMKKMKEQGSPLRPHFFLPLLIHHKNENNLNGMIRLLQAMQNYKMYYDRSSLFTSVLSIFSNHEEVLKACEDSQDTLLFVVRTLFSYDLDQLHKLLSYPSFPPMEFTLYYKNFINTFRWCNDMTHIQAVTELICTDRRFSGGKDVMSFILSKLIKNTTEAELMAMTTKLQTYLTWLKELDVKISERCYTKVRQHLLSCHIPELIEAFAPLVSSTEMVSNSTTPPLPDGALAPLVSSTEMVSNSTTPPLPDGALAPLVSSTEMVSNSTTPPLPDGALAPLVSSTAMVFNSKTPPLPDVSVQALENRMQELKEDKKPYNILFERVLRLVMLEGELEHALKLKQQNKEQMTLTSYLSLIALCCKHKEVEKVLELNREMNARYPESVLQPVKYMSLVTFFCRNGKVEEAENILKEMKEKNVTLDNRSTRMLRTMLNVFAIEGNIPLIKRLLEIVLTLGLLSPTRNICAPLIVAHLKSNDLQGALDTAQECLKSFRVLPPLYRLVVRLVEERDTELLQKALEMLTLEHGQMSTLYTLFFAFLDTGHYEEARKIIESNDLEARKVSLQWFAEKCIRAKKMKALEQMVDITRNLSNCDRDDLYCYILRLCKVNNDTEKAKAVWLKMKEENIVLRQRTQLLLAELLRTDSNGVPFEVPETWYQDTAATLEDTATTLEDTATTLEDTTTTALEDTTTTASEDTTTTASEDTTTTASEDTTTTASEDTTTTASEDTTTTASEDTTTTASEDTTTTASEDTTTTLKDLIKLEEDLTNLSENGKSKEAFMMLKEANERDLILSEDTDKKLISAPKGAKAMMDAQRVKGLSMLSQAKNKAYSLLLNDLSKKNKPKDALEMLKYMLEMEIRPVESAVPQLVYALRDQGDIKGIKEVESQIGSLKRPPKIPIMLFHHNLALAHIKNGDVQSAIDILEEIYISGDQKDSSMSFVFKKLFHDGNDGAIDKISAMAERLANQFASYRPAMDLFLQLLATDKVEDARAMLNRVSALDEQQKTMMSYAKKGSRGKELVKQKKNLLIIFPDMFEKATQYNALLECYVKEEDFVQAKAVFEQMWSEGLPIDEGIHKQLVLLYSKAGETFQSDCSLTQTD